MLQILRDAESGATSKSCFQEFVVIGIFTDVKRIGNLNKNGAFLQEMQKNLQTSLRNFL
jgi:hypothetical protein